MGSTHPLVLAEQRSQVAHGLNGQRVKIRASNVSFYYGRFRALHHVLADYTAFMLIEPFHRYGS
jgi:hypothetical protein